MSWYVYRFLDKGQIIYVGKTNSIDVRVNAHFSNGHLSTKQYERVNKIEYVELETESDQHVMEIYLINKWKPEFNTSDKKEGALGVEVNANLEWIEHSRTKEKEGPTTLAGYLKKGFDGEDYKAPNWLAIAVCMMFESGMGLHAIISLAHEVNKLLLESSLPDEYVDRMIDVYKQKFLKKEGNVSRTRSSLV